MNVLRTRSATLALSLLIAGLVFAACGSDTTTVAPAPTTTTTTTAATTTNAATAPATTGSTTTSATTTTNPATTTVNTAPQTTTTAATAPATTANGGTVPIGNAVAVDTSSKIYLDDRSNALELMRSFYNAINRKEYVRAYGYWGDDNSGQPFKTFADGYAKTASVQMSVAAITGDAGAGNRTYFVPVILNSTNTDGTTQIFAGCYVARQAVAANFAAPPFKPMNIGKANVTAVKTQADAPAALAANCASAGATTGNPALTLTPAPDAPAIDKNNYVDSRNDPVAVIRSFYNAINRKEYVRAYSYWASTTPNAQGLPPAYADFAKGYADTASVQLTTGKATLDPGAGQINSQVPFSLISTHTDGKTQTFVGCYTLKQSNPAIFAEPPFKSLGIVNAKVQEVPANSNTSDQLAKACQ